MSEGTDIAQHSKEVSEDVQPSQSPPKTPSVVASTLNTYSCSIVNSLIRERKLQPIEDPTNHNATSPPKIPTGHIEDPKNEVNYFKSAQWQITPPPHFSNQY